MNKQMYLIFGCHSHQPVGNFDHVFAEAYEKAYKPFLDVLERHPGIHVTQHFTGPLLDWFLKHQPRFLQRLRAHVEAGQIEIMGGAYYEPLLCAIPRRDSLEQIKRMNGFCEKHFGQPPRGMWLTERVWEPHMPAIMAQAGIEYTALDDTHFQYGGLRREELFGYYVTEDEGYAVKVFPILKPLRYAIPFHQVHKSIEFLRANASSEGPPCAVIHDDGEKFGVWPETHRSVYEEGWLDEFFQAVTEEKEWLHSVTYREYLEQAGPLGRVYLTCASYEEMMAWALPTDMQRRLKRVEEWVNRDETIGPDAQLFLRGGFWRGFLAKYPEANNMHKKMLYVSHKLQKLEAEKGPSTCEEARLLLHQGQCNCAYWHGVFGGLYLNHLRTAVYEKLIRAETCLDELVDRPQGWTKVEEVDFDADGNDEVILENSQLWLGLSPYDGGGLFELDYKPKAFNLNNVLTRRDELYHDDLREGRVSVGDEGGGDQSIHELIRAKESGLEAYLIYDNYRRISLRDHFVDSDVTETELWANTFEERGDFATAPYAYETGNGEVTLTRAGVVHSSQGGGALVRVSKTIRLAEGDSTFTIRYDLDNIGDESVSTCFGVEFLANLLSGATFDRYYRSDDRDLGNPKLGEHGCHEEINHWALRDDWQQLELGLRFNVPATLFHFPLETVSQSEGGQERIYQGSVVFPVWPLVIDAGQRTSLEVIIELSETGS